jgi:hypothetical protein
MWSRVFRWGQRHPNQVDKPTGKQLIRIKTQVNPLDPEWEVYFKQRADEKKQFWTACQDIETMQLDMLGLLTTKN